MATIYRLNIAPPLMNSSCAWSSELHELQELFNSPHTGAVTTRTATLTGYGQTSANTVVFTNETQSSLNSFGYSPHPLSTYIDNVRTILANAPEGSVKPVIFSITSSSPSSLASMMDAIQNFRTEVHDSEGPTSRVAVELNTSCPNIRGSPPPAYSFSLLSPILKVLASYFWNDTTLVIGLKLAPYVYSTQFEDIVKAVASFSRPDPKDVSRRVNPFAFFTSTNTLGNSLLFFEQTFNPKTIEKSEGYVNADASSFSLPTILGGLAGEAIHPLSLGNVRSLTQLLHAHEDESMRAISVIGVGGVTTNQAHRRMRSAGAKVVACATLLGREGVRAFEILSIENE